MPGDEGADLLLQLQVLRRAEEAAVGHGLEDVEVDLDAGGAEPPVHSYRVREEQVARARLEEGGREGRREVPEQR